MSISKNKKKISKYNPMSKEFQEEANRLGLSGNQYHQLLIEEGILPRTVDVFIRTRNKKTERLSKETINYYKKFMRVVHPFVPILKEQINKSNYKNIMINTEEIKENIKQFANMKDEEIYSGLKLALFANGIVINREKDENVLLMRMGCEDDTLPYPLNEFLNIYLKHRLYLEEINKEIEESKILIKKYSTLSDAIHKISIISDYAVHLKENGTINYIEYDHIRRQLDELSCMINKRMN